MSCGAAETSVSWDKLAGRSLTPSCLFYGTRSATIAASMPSYWTAAVALVRYRFPALFTGTYPLSESVSERPWLIGAHFSSKLALDLGPGLALFVGARARCHQAPRLHMD